MTDAQTLDWTTKMVNGLIEHWYLLVGLAIVGRWTLPWAMRFVFPVVLKTQLESVMPEALKTGLDKYFSNGGGDKVRAIVKSENEVQSRRHAEELDVRFRLHNAEEAERFAKGERRFQQIEEDLAEVSQTRSTLKAQRRRRGDR